MANAKLEAKALAAESKSAGMRLLLENNYTVAQVRDLFEVPYGFAYGVARRAKLIQSTPRAAKAPAKAKATTKAAAKPAPRTKVAVKGSKSKAKSKA